MCGIAGFFGEAEAPEVMAANARAMAARLVHRGPDGGGTWFDPQAGIALAHRRLAVVDLSSAGAQPMQSASGRWIVVYNGEVYNHLDLRRELEAATSAPAWRGHSDTETLLACIETWGVEATLQRCVGMFAFALWDREERVLVLARDRMGEKPLYYGWQGKLLLFGSELKALRAHPRFVGSVDRGALALLLRYNYVPSPHSIYSGIFKLPPGTWIELRPGEGEALPRAYWSLPDVAECGEANPFTGSDDEALDALEEVLGRSVARQRLADVPLGTLLSGGIDSTLITALMQARSSEPISTFTIGFAEGAYNEAHHAKAVADHLGTRHTELVVSAHDVLAVIPRLASMYDEPFADSSQLPTSLVMQLARNHVTVALSGDGGDELFAGYNRHFLGPAIWKRIGWMPLPVRRTLGAAMRSLPAGKLNVLEGVLGVAQLGDKVHKLGRYLSDVQGIDDLYASAVTEWPDSSAMMVNSRSLPTLLDSRERWPKFSDPTKRMMALDGMTYLPDDVLVKVDRAAMAVSLETRAPFLDRDVMEFAWRLPAAMRLRDGKGKWILRKLLGRYVRDSLMERPKMGFGIPLDDWLRTTLREWAGDLLSEACLRRSGYFHPELITSTWNAHQRGEGRFGYRLWSVLMFQSWLAAQEDTH